MAEPCQDSTFEDLVQHNDGFRTGLTGAPERIAERIAAYELLGVDLFLLGFPHCLEQLEQLEQVEYFGKRVLPLGCEPGAEPPESEPAAEPTPATT